MSAVPWRQLCSDILSDVFEERENQVERFGEAHEASLKDGTGPHVSWLEGTRRPDRLGIQSATDLEVLLREAYEQFEKKHGKITWRHLVLEEVAEAFKESNPDRLEAELLQVAALCVAWIAQIRTR